MSTLKVDAVVASLVAALGTVAIPAATHAMDETRPHAMESVDVDAARAVYNLELAAQRLRGAIQAIAQQPQSLARDQAASAVHRALFDVSQAMFRLPARYRADAGGDRYPPVAGPRPLLQGYDLSIQQLQAASDRLSDVRRAIARERDGTLVDAAMREVDDALGETHGALAWVFDQRLAAASWSGDRGSTSECRNGPR